LVMPATHQVCRKRPWSADTISWSWALLYYVWDEASDTVFSDPPGLYRHLFRFKEE
jgi:hypothetical protein